MKEAHVSEVVGLLLLRNAGKVEIPLMRLMEVEESTKPFLSREENDLINIHAE